jgi:5-methylcytosine-specific restriction endonuclease McrA
MLEASKRDQSKRSQDPHAKALVREIQRKSRQKCYMDPEKKPRILALCRESRHRRRALLAKAIVEPVTPGQKLSRWAEFDNCCAYCGATGKMDVEHWIPISKGGAHALGNILPACSRCNRSKWNRAPESWYRSRSYFSEDRLSKIHEVLKVGRPAHAQISLL